MTHLILWPIVSILLIVGLAGTVLPGLPGIMLVFGGILVYAVATGFESISVLTVSVFGVISVLAVAADYFGSVIATRAGGGRWPTLVATGIGALAGGITAGPLGIVLGAFLGALAGALYEGQRNTAAVKMALYAVLGVLGATAVQFLLALVLIIAFFTALVF